MVPSHVSPGRRRTRRHDANALQHGCCGSLGATAPPTLRPALATGADGTLTFCACRLATRHALQRDDSRPSGGALGLRAALPHRFARRYDGVRHLRQHQHGNAQGSPWPPYPSRQGSQCLRWQRVVPRLRRRASTRHFARIRGVGLFRRARPSDVPAVP
jgi:hypothetical protein